MLKENMSQLYDVFRMQVTPGHRITGGLEYAHHWG